MELDRRDLIAGSLAFGAAALVSEAGEAAVPAPVLFAHPPATIPVLGSNQRFQVRRIYCVGRNYALHAIERGSDPNREPPFFFQKPTDAVQLVPKGKTIDHPYPSMTKNYHHEVELVAALGKGGRNVKPEAALDMVFGYAVGLDMTRRDLQNAMADQKKPWEIGKSFDHAAVVSHLHPAAKLGHPESGAIWLKVNGTTKQSSDLKKMIWNVAEQVAHLSQYYELRPGDIIYSGTPENVGPVVPGDLMEAHIDGIYDISVRVVAAQA
ncbi:MAG: fumarylacetoacetate hydrolase family protein [Proteobacteria bacterium]|nr:fumarylacetoacetate hydrolase family protein [Pseudomonadota bacterium]